MASKLVMGRSGRRVLSALGGAVVMLGGFLAGSGLPTVAAQAQGPWFNSPTALALRGDDLFVANPPGGSVTELNASTGALARVISGRQYQFNGPQAPALYGDDLFAANEGGNSVTEVNASTGALVRVISGPK